MDTLWEDPLIFLTLSVWNYCDGLPSYEHCSKRLKLNYTIVIQTDHGLEKFIKKYISRQVLFMTHILKLQNEGIGKL